MSGQQSLPGIYKPAQQELPRQEAFHINYESFRALLTPSELAFYRVLRAALPKLYVICPKVRIADLLDYSGKSSRYGGLLRVASKHVDFAVIRESDSAIVMAIELDSHHHRWQKKTIDRDRFVNEAFRSAGLPLARFDDSLSYEVAEVQAELRKCYLLAAA